MTKLLVEVCLKLSFLSVRYVKPRTIIGFPIPGGASHAVFVFFAQRVADAVNDFCVMGLHARTLSGAVA